MEEEGVEVEVICQENLAGNASDYRCELRGKGPCILSRRPVFDR